MDFSIMEQNIEGNRYDTPQEFIVETLKSIFDHKFTTPLL